MQLVATPDYGYKFVRWTVGGEEVSTSAEYTDNTDGNKEYVAVFEKFASTDEWYAAIDKPTFGKTGNTTFITSATVDDVAVENIPEYIAGNDVQGVGKQSGVTTAIEVAPGAQFNLNITYQLNWGDLAIYQIDNDGATKEYGYYFGSWTATNPNTGKVIENIANDGISVSDIVDDVCTVTYPISINENHNVGDVIVVRAITGVINNTTNSAYEQGIGEGGYVDFLFVVAEEEPAEDTSDWASFEGTVEQTGKFYERQQYDRAELQRTSCHPHHNTVKTDPQGFRQYFSILHHHQCEPERKQCDISLIAIDDPAETCAGNCRTDGVGGSIYNKDDCQRIIDIGFQFLYQLADGW